MNLFKSLKNSNNAINQIHSPSYHQIHAQEAKNIYENIKTYKTELSIETEKAIEHYSLDVFGSVDFIPWLRVYSILRGEFIEGWIPDNYFGEYVVPLYKGGHGKISNLSIFNFSLFEKEYLPDQIYFANEIFFDSDLNFLPENQLREILFRKSSQVIFKRDNSLQGLGISIIDKSDFDLEKIKKYGNGVFQYFVDQHSSLKKFIDSSVCTLRITTVVNNNGESSVRAAYLKIGRSGDRWVKALNHILVPIDVDSGKLHIDGYDTNWYQHRSHPDTNVEFRDTLIPNFDLILELALSWQKRVPFIRSIGWDFAVDSAGKPKILEWNAGHNGIKLSEATVGPCFNDLGWEALWRKN